MIPKQSFCMGYRLIENIRMIVPDETKLVKLTLKEQFFSWPWKPFKAYKEVTTFKPDSRVIKDDINMVLIAHPILIKEIIEQFEKK